MTSSFTRGSYAEAFVRVGDPDADRLGGPGGTSLWIGSYTGGRLRLRDLWRARCGDPHHRGQRRSRTFSCGHDAKLPVGAGGGAPFCLSLPSTPHHALPTSSTPFPPTPALPQR